LDALMILLKDFLSITLSLCVWAGIWMLFGKIAKSKGKLKLVDFAWIMGGLPAMLSVFAYVKLAIDFAEAVAKSVQ